MKNKTALALMEQLVMVLVFALAAALCLGLFAESSRLSQTNRRREEAALLAQSAAELIQTGGDPATLDTGDLDLEVQHLDSPVPGYLRSAAVTVRYDAQILFQLTVGWQEVGP